MWAMASTDDRRARLSIDVSTTTRRRVRLAAAMRDQSIRDYVVGALQERLREDLGEDETSESATLNESADPVLGTLWRNARDQVYDDL